MKIVQPVPQIGQQDMERAQHSFKSLRACAHCLFFFLQSQEDGLGQCRAQPPQIIQRVTDTSSTTLRTWPTVDTAEWCGSFTLDLTLRPMRKNQD